MAPYFFFLTHLTKIARNTSVTASRAVYRLKYPLLLGKAKGPPSRNKNTTIIHACITAINTATAISTR